MTKCSCLGRNPNCFICGGWGEIDEISSGKSSKPESKIKCPFCSMKFENARALEEHVNAIHPELNKCPFCKVFIKIKNLETHIRKKHPNQWETYSEQIEVEKNIVMVNNLVKIIGNLSNNISDITLWDEASIKQSVILHILSVLGWNTFNNDEVKPEYTVKSKRVDYSLRINNENKIFIEAKRPNQKLDAHQEQLLGYSFMEGVKLAVLTNGLTWWFYLPLNEGNWENRRFYTADLLEQDPQTIAEFFFKLISKKSVESGNSIITAKDLYKNRKKKNALNETLPKAWNKIINDPDEILVELLIETTEKLSGFRPDKSKVENFLDGISKKSHQNSNFVHLKNSHTTEKNNSNFPSPIQQKMLNKSISVPASESASRNSAIPNSVGFVLHGKFYPEKSARRVMISIFLKLQELNPNFFHAFISLEKHGTTRRYLGQSPSELFPNRPDFVKHQAKYWEEISPGWYMDIHKSKNSIERTIEMACEVENLTLGVDLKIDLG